MKKITLIHVYLLVILSSSRYISSTQKGPHKNIWSYDEWTASLPISHKGLVRDLSTLQTLQQTYRQMHIDTSKLYRALINGLHIEYNPTKLNQAEPVRQNKLYVQAPRKRNLKSEPVGHSQLGLAKKRVTRIAGEVKRNPPPLPLRKVPNGNRYGKRVVPVKKVAQGKPVISKPFLISHVATADIKNKKPIVPLKPTQPKPLPKQPLLPFVGAQLRIFPNNKTFRILSGSLSSQRPPKYVISHPNTPLPRQRPPKYIISHPNTPLPQRAKVVRLTRTVTAQRKPRPRPRSRLPQKPNAPHNPPTRSTKLPPKVVTNDNMAPLDVNVVPDGRGGLRFDVVQSGLQKAVPYKTLNTVPNGQHKPIVRTLNKKHEPPALHPLNTKIRPVTSASLHISHSLQQRKQESYVPQRRQIVNSPSVLNFRPNNQHAANKPVSSIGNQPSLVSFDPFWKKWNGTVNEAIAPGKQEIQQKSVYLKPFIISHVEDTEKVLSDDPEPNSVDEQSPSKKKLPDLLPVSPSFQRPQKKFVPSKEIENSYMVQEPLDADVVPDGKGGMKIAKPQRVVHGTLRDRKKYSGKNVPKGYHSPRIYTLGNNGFTEVGCFSDNWIRAIPILDGNHPLLMDSDYKSREDALQKCAEAALERHFRIFALQNGGQCFSGKNSGYRYGMYGKSDKCKDDGLGGTWANEVYMFHNDPILSKIPPKVTAGSLKDKLTEPDENDSDVSEYDDFTRGLEEDSKESGSNKREGGATADARPQFQGVLGEIVNKALKKKKDDPNTSDAKLPKQDEGMVFTSKYDEDSKTEVRKENPHSDDNKEHGKLSDSRFFKDDENQHPIKVQNENGIKLPSDEHGDGSAIILPKDKDKAGSLHPCCGLEDKSGSGGTGGKEKEKTTSPDEDEDLTLKRIKDLLLKEESSKKVIKDDKIIININPGVDHHSSVNERNKPSETMEDIYPNADRQQTKPIDSAEDERSDSHKNGKNLSETYEDINQYSESKNRKIEDMHYGIVKEGTKIKDTSEENPYSYKNIKKLAPNRIDQSHYSSEKGQHKTPNVIEEENESSETEQDKDTDTNEENNRKNRKHSSNNGQKGNKDFYQSSTEKGGAEHSVTNDDDYDNTHIHVHIKTNKASDKREEKHGSREEEENNSADKSEDNDSNNQRTRKKPSHTQEDNRYSGSKELKTSSSMKEKQDTSDERNSRKQGKQKEVDTNEEDRERSDEDRKKPSVACCEKEENMDLDKTNAESEKQVRLSSASDEILSKVKTDPSNDNVYVFKPNSMGYENIHAAVNRLKGTVKERLGNEGLQANDVISMKIASPVYNRKNESNSDFEIDSVFKTGNQQVNQGPHKHINSGDNEVTSNAGEEKEEDKGDVAKAITEMEENRKQQKVSTHINFEDIAKTKLVAAAKPTNDQLIVSNLSNHVGEKEMEKWGKLMGGSTVITPVNTPANTPVNTPANTLVNTPAIKPAIAPANTPVNTPPTTLINTPAIKPAIAPAITPVNTPVNTPAIKPAITPAIAPVNTPAITPAITPVIGTPSKDIHDESGMFRNNSNSLGEERRKQNAYPLLGHVLFTGHKPPCICPERVCSSRLNLAFAIDASPLAEQNGEEKMGQIVEFSRQVASAFTFSPVESHLGLITYATDAQIMVNFNRFRGPDSLLEARNSVKVKPHTGKYAGQALMLAKEGLFDRGHRSNALDVLILLTDGPTSDEVIGPARALRDMGVTIISVGISLQADRKELNEISSDPDDEHVFITDYDTLTSIIHRTQKAACVGGTLHNPLIPCNCNDPEVPDAEASAFLEGISSPGEDDNFYTPLARRYSIAQPHDTKTNYEGSKEDEVFVDVPLMKYEIPEDPLLRMPRSSSSIALKKEGKIAMAVKKDNTEKGVLTKDPFLDASHYWPLETSHSILTTDIVSGHNAILMGGSSIKESDEFQEYVSTEGNGSYIIAGDFKGTCFSNPDKCIMNGMTVSFWVNLKSGAVKPDQDAYILSSGGQSKKSRGIAFLFFHGKYVYVVSTKSKQWKMYIEDIPTDKWINIAFVWRNNEGLAYYLDGEKKQSVNATAASRPSIEYTILTVSRPNNAVNTEFMYPLQMCCLALWDKPLKKQQVKSAYESIKRLHEHPALKRRRSRVRNKKTNISQKPTGHLVDSLK